jgi:hypothetical protein
VGGPFNFVSAILDAHVPAGTDWREHVIASAKARGLELAGEDVTQGAAFVAWARLYDPGEAEAAFGQAPWFSLADRGEFRGRPVGFFSWEHYGASQEPFDQMAVFDFRGTIGRLDTGDSREPIAERRFTLDNLLARFGFADGEALLRTEGHAYDDAVCTRIEAALAAAGYPASIGVGINRDTTIHNPVTLIGNLLRRGADGEEIPATDEILAPIEVELVTYNLELLSAREKEFWRWP